MKIVIGVFVSLSSFRGPPLRHRGKFAYLQEPLPRPMNALREALYEALAPAANAQTLGCRGVAEWWCRAFRCRVELEMPMYVVCL